MEEECGGPRRGLCESSAQRPWSARGVTVGLDLLAAHPTRIGPEVHLLSQLLPASVLTLMKNGPGLSKTLMRMSVRGAILRL